MRWTSLGRIKSFFKREKPKQKQIFEQLLDEFEDAFYVLDVEWRFTYINNKAEGMFLRKKESLIGKVIWDEFPEELCKALFEKYTNTVQQQTPSYFQFYYMPYDKWIEIRLNPNKYGLFVLFRDITDLKRELVLNKEHYRSLFDLNPDAVYSLDLDGNYISVNNSFENITGYSQDEALKLHLVSLIAPEDKERTINYFQLAAKGLAQNYNIQVVTKYGTKLNMNITNVPIIVQNKIVGVYGIAKDITANVHKQEKLRKSKEMYTLISENSQDVISYSTPEGICKFVSPAVTQLLGYRQEELLNKPITDYYHPDDLPHNINQKNNDVDVWRGRIRHKNGEYIWFEISSKIIRNSEGAIEKILGVARDISERMKAEQLMRTSEKLTLAGQLAAGVAHEIRNPLTAVKGFLQIMQSGQTLQKEYLDVMYLEIIRIESIVKELLLLAKPHKVAFIEKNVHVILEHVVTLIHSEAIKENVTIKMDLYPKELFVNCEENQIKQVLINLIKNSIEAMPYGGDICIHTDRKDDMIMITLTDTGEGIPPEVISKIGQPFYTTKEKGTGLGLAVSNNIMDIHKGKIHIESKKGQGTTFTIYLPISKGT